jgi:DNA-binding LacI/PurR family transcriptional regulator
MTAAAAVRRVPNELAVIAWNDSPVCELVDMTAIRRDDAADGALAARLLLKHLNTGVPEHGAASPGELIIRGTT